MNVYYVLGTVLGSGATAVNKTTVFARGEVSFCTSAGIHTQDREVKHREVNDGQN